VGDHRQLAAVGAGGGMELIAASGARYELAEARRFTHEWERAASLRLRDGDEAVLRVYHQHGRLIDAGTSEQAEDSAARAWLGDTLALRNLRENIAAAEHHLTAIRWLTKPAIAPVLADLAAGRMPLTHAAFDELGDSQALAHLRQTLVAVGALPERDEALVRLERFLAGLLAAQPGPDRRKILHRYLIWHLLRRLRGRNNARPTSRQQALRIRNHARAAAAFLDWLGAQNLTLGGCTQADLDRWCGDDSGVYRVETGNFLRWTHANKLTAGHLASVRWGGPAQLLDDQHRWDTARRLLHDEDLKAEDRLAGLLVLLYAQGATAISRMTVEQIHIDAHDVRLQLGRVPIQLPEPVAALARAVIGNRKGHATIGALAPSPWLFPGGQPRRPISTARLTQRLTNIGIRPNQTRSTALFQLATEIPAAILARTLGIHTDVAVTWQRLSSGDWATYAAEVSQRRTTPRDDPVEMKPGTAGTRAEGDP
jgi:hypothetical protein